MVYKIVVNGVDLTAFVDLGFSTHEKLDESLDIANITVTHSIIDNQYTMWDDVEIYVDGVLKQVYKIGGDSVSLISKNPLTYKHDLSLVEPIKYYETFMINGFTLTQPLEPDVSDPIKTLKDALDFLRVNAQSNGAPLLTVDSTTSTLLDNFTSPEFTFKDITYRQAMDNIMGVLDGITRINSSGNIEIQLFNELQTLITDLSPTVNRTLSQDITLYGKYMDVNVLNAVNDNSEVKDIEIYPTDEQYTTHRFTSDLFDEGKMFIPTPKPIYEIDEVLWKGVIKPGYGPYVGVDTDFILNLTPRIFEKVSWDSLQADSKSTTLAALEREDYENYFKSNSIYYNYGEKNITDNMTTGIFDTGLVIDYAILAELNRLYAPFGSVGDGVHTIKTSPENYLWLIKYKPIHSELNLHVKKEKTEEHGVNSYLHSNQQSRVIDLNDFVNNIQGKINRLGNSDLQLENRINDYDNAYNIGDFTDEDYIVTERELIYFNDYIYAKYRLTRDFNRISEFISVNSEIRQWEIGEKGRTLARDWITKDEVNILVEPSSAVGSRDSSNHLEDLGIKTYMDTVNNDSNFLCAKISDVIPRDNSDNNYFVTESKSVKSYNQLTGLTVEYAVSSVCLPLTANGVGNVLVFTGETRDNKIVDEYTSIYKTSISSKILKEYANYTSEDGEVEKYDFNIYTKLPEQSSANDERIIGDLLPYAVIDGSSLLNNIPLSADKLIGISNENVYKDRRTNLKFIYTLQTISLDRDETIVGDLFTTLNNLVTDNTSKKEVNADNFVSGETYEISFIGTTDFTLLGATSNTIGEQFVCIRGDASTGRAYLINPNTKTLRIKMSQTSRFTRLDKKKLPSTYVEYNPSGFTGSYTVTQNYTNYTSKINNAYNDTSVTSWCIVDENDNVLLATNQYGVVKDTITYDFK